MREAQTTSYDLSSNGIYFGLPERIDKDTSVELEMTLPGRITLAGPLRVRCFGRITRCVLDQDERPAMAARIEKYRFLRKNDEARTEEVLS
jgi:hypothetical protein